MRCYYLLQLWLALAVSGHAAVTIDWVTVGDAGNGADAYGYGAVSYSYRISKYEVTNAQYVEFLNAVAATDKHDLYNAGMGTDACGGITRSGTSGSYTYSAKKNMGNKPVNYVSHLDAQRFANWLHNGQGKGSTEKGAYHVKRSAVRNVEASVWIPTASEWYKAAYFQPGLAGSDKDSYWLYPTRSNSVPARATANGTGDIANTGSNVANYNGGAGWNGQTGNVTTVGSAGAASASYYGTYDQGGNVMEWSEEFILETNRGLCGGCWSDIQGHNMKFAYFNPATFECGDVGFRLASAVPKLLVGRSPAQ